MSETTLATHRALEAIHRLAATHSGVVSRAAALEAGCSHADLARLFRMKRLRTVDRGVYEVTSPANWFHRELQTMLLQTGDGAVVSHRSAGVLYQFWGIEGYPRECTIPMKRRVIAGGGCSIHRCPLADGDVVDFKGLKVTSVPRTLCDLAAVLEPEMLAVAFESVRRSRPQQLAVLAARLKAQKRPREGTEALLELLADSARRPDRSMESPFEVGIWRRIGASGLPMPTPQVLFETARGRKYFIDFAYVQQKVAIEVDGWGYHSSKKAYIADARKMAALKEAGWKLIRIWWERYLDELPDFFRELRRDLNLPSLPE